MKLLPPSIESKLPAQVGDTIRIPFLHNRTVGRADYEGFSLIIKTISTNKSIGPIDGDSNAVFPLGDIKLEIGQYYKAQIAYRANDDNKTIGYYSTIGIFKYTVMPELSLSSNNKVFSAIGHNTLGQKLIGLFEQKKDSDGKSLDANEKVYSYCFNIYCDNDLLLTSGEQIHNSTNDTDINTSEDVFNCNIILDPLKFYRAEYQVTTTNGLKLSTPQYLVSSAAQLPKKYDLALVAKADNDSGSIAVYIDCAQNVEGNFVISRSCSKDNYTSKDVIIDSYSINAPLNGKYLIYTDYTTEQGMSYRYSIQQVSDKGIETEEIFSNIETSDFEDLFLYDGSRQLKVRFNPKVSSFKNTIQESKLDTIGGRYPFIFRNGRMKYKEFPVSGMISYWMDNDELFMPEFVSATCQRTQTPHGKISEQFYRSTNLIGDNMAAERKFKLEVLEWLNNGKPKLFRSPAEGNYLVRLLNISLSPEEKLSRMIHTFSSTAYEIASADNDSLKQYGLVGKVSEINPVLRFYSVEMGDDKVSIPNASFMRLYGYPQSVYTLTLSNGKEQSITIGVTGLYEYQSDVFPVISVTYHRPSVLDYIEYDEKIEYATTKVVQQSLLHNGIDVDTIEVKEHCKQLISGTETILLEDLFDTTYILDNILFLRVEYIGDSSSFITIDGNTIELSKNQNKNESAISSRLEFTANDFDGHFAPSTMEIGPDVIVDIYYKAIVINGGGI